MILKKPYKIILVAGMTIFAAAAAAGIYMYNKPVRNIQKSPVDYYVNSSDLVREFLSASASANDKYLDDAGNSSILAITGPVSHISRDLNNQVVILLKTDDDEAGVSCTFFEETNKNAEAIRKGQIITVKGVIRSGAAYDVDIDLYEDVIIEKCDVIEVKKQ
jgi:hypothetical protein